MRYNKRPRKRMTIFVRLNTARTSDKPASAGQPEPMQNPVGEMVNGVWVGK